MNNLEYLNQISQSSRPVKTRNNPSAIPIKFILKIVGGTILAFIALMIIGTALGNAGNKVSELSRQTYLRAANLNATVQAYGPQVKSSKLRSISASLSSVLTESSNQLANYLQTNKDGSKKDKEALSPKQSIIDAETALAQETNNTLANARLNGLLDRVYANQIQLQVSLLLSLCAELYDRAKDPKLSEIVNSLGSNLSVIEDNLKSYINLGS